MSEGRSAAATGRSFFQVALVFVGLLAIGLVFAFVVYRKYVAYEPTVARHAPPDAGIVVRLDLTHVMLYEPFRRSIMPLADEGGRGARSRQERLAEKGIRLGADVRELLLAVGPGRRDFALVIGGQLPKAGLAATVAELLAAEGRELDVRPDGVRILRSSGFAFAQAADGAFVLGSGEARVRSMLPVRAADPDLSEGSGGARVSGSRLGPPWRNLRASLRAGSFVAVDAEAQFSDSRAGSEALTSLLREIASLDATLVHPVESAARTVTDDGAKTSFRISLPKEAVEVLARWLGARAVQAFTQPADES